MAFNHQSNRGVSEVDSSRPSEDSVNDFSLPTNPDVMNFSDTVPRYMQPNYNTRLRPMSEPNRIFHSVPNQRPLAGNTVFPQNDGWNRRNWPHGEYRNSMHMVTNNNTCTVNPFEVDTRPMCDMNGMSAQSSLRNNGFAPINQNRPNYGMQNRFPRNYAPRMKTVPIHQWKISFSGEDQRVSETDLSASEFVFQANVHKEAQMLSDGDMLSQIGVLLTHRAKTWYFARHRRFYSWETFVEALRKTFMSSHHHIDALLDIANRIQKPNESARTYLYHMLMLFQTLPQQIDEDIQVRIILGNMSANIVAIVGPWDPKTINELDRILHSVEPRRSAF